MPKILKVVFWGIVAIIVAKFTTYIFYQIYPPDLSKGVDQIQAMLAAFVGIISASPFLILLVKLHSKVPKKNLIKVNQETLQDRDYYAGVKEIKRKE